MLVGKSAVVRDSIIPRVREISIVGLLRDIGLVVNNSVIKLSQTIAAVSRSKQRLDLKALHRSNLQIHVAQTSPGLFLLRLVHQSQQRVRLIRELIAGARTHSLIVTRLLVQLTLSIIGLHERVHTERKLHCVVVAVCVAHVRQVQVQTGLHVLVDVRVNRTLDIDSALLITYVDTFFLVVSYTEVISYMLRRTVNRYIMVLLHTVAGHHTRPVPRVHSLRVIAAHDLFQTAALRIVVPQGHLLKRTHLVARRTVYGIGKTAGIRQEFGKTVVVELFSVHEVVHTNRIRETIVEIVTDSRLGLFLTRVRTTLRRHHDHTGRGAATVNSGRRCVLQYVDSADVRRIQEINVIADDSIYYIDRLRIRVGRRLTTNLYIKSSTYTTRRLSDVHTGYGTLQGLYNARRTTSRDSVRSYR